MPEQTSFINFTNLFRVCHHSRPASSQAMRSKVLDQALQALIYLLYIHGLLYSLFSYLQQAVLPFLLICLLAERETYLNARLVQLPVNISEAYCEGKRKRNFLILTLLFQICKNQFCFSLS